MRCHIKWFLVTNLVVFAHVMVLEKLEIFRIMLQIVYR